MMLIIRISSGGEVTDVTVLFTCLLHVWAGKLEIANGIEFLAECPMSLGLMGENDHTPKR